MKKMIPFIYRNFKYYLAVDEQKDTAAILDQFQNTVSVTAMSDWGQSLSLIHIYMCIRDRNSPLPPCIIPSPPISRMTANTEKQVSAILVNAI